MNLERLKENIKLQETRIKSRLVEGDERVDIEALIARMEDRVSILEKGTD